MALTASALASDSDRAFSLGPLKAEVLNFSADSGDTSGTITALRLSTIRAAVVCGGVILTAAPTVSGNQVTLAFANPGATRHGQIILLGS